MRLIVAAVLLWAFAAARGAGSPDQERHALLDYFKQRFPEIPVQQYVHGALMLSPDAKAQYDTIMEFPPFQA